MTRAKVLAGTAVVVSALGGYWMATDSAPPVEHRLAVDLASSVASAASGLR
jgi:hypothetical protein